MSNRLQNFLYGFIASIGGSIVLQLVTLIVVPIYLDYTSQEIYGMWVILLSIFGWLQFGDMGIGMSLTIRSVKCLENQNHRELNKFLYSAIISFFLMGLFFLIPGFILKNYIIDFFNINFENSQDFINTYLILLIIGFLSPISKIFASLIEAHQRIDFLKISGALISILVVIFTIILLHNDFGILSFAYGLSLKLILTPFVELIFLKKIDSKFRLIPIIYSKKHIFSLLNFGGKFQILKIANMITSSADILIIGVYLSASFATVYTFTSKLAFIFSIGFISLLPSVLFPGLSQLFVQNDFTKLRIVYLSILKLSLRLGIFISIFYYCVNESFVNVWVGSENYGGDDLTNIFVIWIIIESILRGVTAIIYASGKLTKLTIYSIIEALLNVVFTIYLIDHF
jgi:O-antigen/teichoic acid export membrane protein